jgi:hypothetical protein
VPRSLIPLDSETVHSRLQKEEQKWAMRLADLENLIRTFEDLDLPSYQAWIRNTFGPKLQEREELVQEIHALRAEARQEIEPERDLHQEKVEARRRVKLETKRAERKAQRKEEKESKRREVITDLRKQVVSLYRILVRKLHPDSLDRLTTLTAERMSSIWQEVQNAYEKDQLEQLISISAWLDSQTIVEIPAPPPSTFSQQSERIRLLRRSCQRTEKRIEQLKDHMAWGFSPDLDPKTLRRIRQEVARDLSDEMEQLQVMLTQLQEFLDSMNRGKKKKHKR